MKALFQKGQGTTEYLIILSVIIVIALVVVGVMGWFPGLGTNITEQQSRAYWASASPIAITAWNVDSSGTDLVFRNLTTDKIEIVDIKFDGTTAISTDYNISAGSQQTATGNGVTCTSAGQAYSYNVVITYNVSGGLTGVNQTGTKPLVGICG